MSPPRRSQPTPPLTIGDLVVDRLRRRVRRDGVLPSRTMREFCGLELLAERAGTLVSPAGIATACGESGTGTGVGEVITKLNRTLGDPRIIHGSAAGYPLHA
ncbi:hypothetical protein ABZ412_31130 [Nocardia sp. NPDC005746]|uniref:hypothetical protein n=1 Tax=Nocardia sp. NPDC005746 TaxID=3157062 RepID=UPI0033E18A54